MTSGVDISRQISLRALTRSRPWARCLRESYRPLVLMSSLMPDRAQGLAGPGEHVGALGYQVFDVPPRGGGVVENFDSEAMCGQRGGRPLQALRGRWVGERCCRGGGSHGAS